MDNQHQKITGYRELDQGEIDLMNEIKAVGPQLKELYDKTAALIAERTKKYGTGDAENYRWLNIGRTQYQQGLMAMTRAVASPNFE